MDNQFTVLAKVKFNDGEAYVLDKNIRGEMLYRKVIVDGEIFFIGKTKTGLFRVLHYSPGAGLEPSFAGRKQILKMEDGSIYENTGDLWETGPDAIEYVSHKDHKDYKQYLPLRDITCNDKEDLFDCYVYWGAYVSNDLYQEITQKAKHLPLMAYYDYEKELKEEPLSLNRFIRILSRIERSQMLKVDRVLEINGKPVNKEKPTFAY